MLLSSQQSIVRGQAAKQRRGQVVCSAKAVTKAEDGRAVRRSLNQTGRYVRHLKDDPTSQKNMERDGVGYSSNDGLVAKIKQSGNQWQEGVVNIKLAKAYGYCWGVERAVRMAYEARTSFPDNNIYIINEIIHNPEVNKKLRAMDIKIIDGNHGEKDYSVIQSGDVVIFPAFGATVQEMKFFRDKGVHMVDTTCPWVAKVWNSVDIHGRKKYTSVIHGKYSHEETIATASFANNYIIIKDLEECGIVSDYIKKGGDKAAFLARFRKSTSDGFDPDVHLQSIGLANQTTMLKDETMKIGKMLEAAMLARYGPEKLNKHFLLMETICDATQERQDALFDLVADPDVDMMLVVGGFNSSNTSHLQEISEHKGLKSFWVDGPDRVDEALNTIQHKLAYGELKDTEGWIEKGKPITVGVTSGASTPDRTVEEVLEKLFKLAN